jgi:hypothetical protein
MWFSSPLLDQLVELSKAKYPDDWSRLCQLAGVIEGQSVSPEEAARRRLWWHSRRYSGDPTPWVCNLSEISNLCGKLVEHFADAFRDQMVGRVEGKDELKRIRPDVVRSEALRFAPDQLVLDNGKLVFVDVRVEPVLQIPNQGARLLIDSVTPTSPERRRKDRERKRRQRARAKASRDVPVTSADVRVTSKEPSGHKLGRKSANDWSTDLKERVFNAGRAIMQDNEKRPADKLGQLMTLATQIVHELGLPHAPDSIARMIRRNIPDLSAMIPTAQEWRERKRKAKRSRR